MTSKEAQSKAGIPEQRRGQQMGDERSQTDKTLHEKEENTPALRGERPAANKYFADESSQQFASSGEAPSDNSPSTPAAIPTDEPLGQSGGEQVFKQNQAKLKGEG